MVLEKDPEKRPMDDIPRVKWKLSEIKNHLPMRAFLDSKNHAYRQHGKIIRLTEIRGDRIIYMEHGVPGIEYGIHINNQKVRFKSVFTDKGKHHE